MHQSLSGWYCFSQLVLPPLPLLLPMICTHPLAIVLCSLMLMHCWPTY